MVLDAAHGESKAVFVAGPGAGSHMDHRSMLELLQVLRGAGFDVVRFNFEYREKGSRVPDRMPKLQSRFSAVVHDVQKNLGEKKLILGGRSMGGRVASMLAADGVRCDGLMLFAYPLHPAGKPEQLRDEHLPKIKVPVLCVNGTRDALCDRVLMERALGKVTAPWTMHWLEGKDHSFRITKELGDAARSWLERL